MLADVTLIYYPVIVCDSYCDVHNWAVVRRMSTAQIYLCTGPPASSIFTSEHSSAFVYSPTALVLLFAHNSADYGKRHDAALGLNAGYAGASDPLVPLGQCSAGQRVQDALIRLLSTQTICSLTGCC